jgi:hypothetical protein
MTDSQIAEKIKKTLEKNFLSLRLRKQAHFSERMYRINGQEKYILTIRNWLTVLYFKFLYQTSLLGKETLEKDAGTKRLKALKTLVAHKKQPRISYYQAMPELKFYQEIIFTLIKISEYQLKAETKIALDYLKKVNWRKYFLDQKLVYLDPVQTTNHVFWLKRLKIVDFVDDYLPLLAKIYPHDKIRKSSALEFHNHFYSYSHIILSASDYYQHFVDPTEYDWIINFFEKNLATALASSNIDLISEIGVIFKLTQQSKSLVKIKSTVVQAFDQTKGLIGKGNNFNNLEHTNTLAIILLTEPFRLYPGPKIEKLAVL